MRKEVIKHFHVFCGLGGGAKGFNQGEARVGNVEAEFKCIGGIDSDPSAIADFNNLAGAKGTVLDLFDREQYIDWHGKEPDDGWRESSPDDIRKAASYERPNIIFTSPPCKGFSGLLSQNKSKSERYQSLNRLTVRGIWLSLEAFKDDPAEFFILENVPRISTRGRELLDQIVKLLELFGYAVAETTHDCGELGGLAQSRKRFLLVARHQEKVPPFLYEPHTKPLKTVGDILGSMPMPGDELAGPMHRIPNLEWKTWVRLAFVEAGKDWRSLQRLNVQDGYLKDFSILPNEVMHNSVYGVKRWNEWAGVVSGRTGPTNGAYSIADPRMHGSQDYGQLGVMSWQDTSGTITSQRSPGQGRFSVSDPRIEGERHKNVFRVVSMQDISPVITAGTGPSSGGIAIADPRPALGSNGLREHYQTGGHFKVMQFAQNSYAVTGKARHDSGPWSVADPRVPCSENIDDDFLPKERDKGPFVIESFDGTWHRPFTTMELAALQGLIEPQEYIHLYGGSDSAWRERIGNAVPPPTAAAIASVMGQAILLARAGETFVLNSMPIWVKPLAVAASVPTFKESDYV